MRETTTTGATPLVVGFIGLGDQGGPMARAVAEAGHTLHVWARRRASLDVLTGVPYTAHDSPTALGTACGIVCLCLPEDADVAGIAFDNGLLAHMRPGSVLVNHGTGLPDLARRLTLAADAYGVGVLDAPVSGGRAGALAKALTTIVGGDPGTAERCRPVFESFSTTVVHMGGAGTGQLGKLFNNTLMMMNHKNVTADNASHLRKLELLDMELFSAAVSSSDVSAEAVVSRAVAGARALEDLVRAVAS
ncbi:NAD(P)-dependent oxidoreductase [Streptomyces sp. NPDC002574]|uniref:NAD(P)-dependent oxidoreductase n=1 Tax=Streptomyces sp. NPDC002574 TaxID=3364652 RepID=UPI003675699E